MNHLFQSNSSSTATLILLPCYNITLQKLLPSQIKYFGVIVVSLILLHLSVFAYAVIRKGTFAKYDYGRLKNLMLYGQLKPPEFDLSEIPSSLPLWMGYGGNDALADVTDVERTIKELPSMPDLLYLDDYGHIDFLLSVRAKEDVYDSMIGFFKSLQNVSSY